MKTSNIILLSLLAVVLIGIIATVSFVKTKIGQVSQIQPSGVVVEEKREVAPFHQLEVSSGIIINYTQNSMQSVVVKADSSLISKVVTTVSDGCLRVAMEGVVVSNSQVVVDLSSAAIDKLDLGSGSSFRTASLKVPSFELQSASGSTTEINGEFDDFKVGSGSGSVNRLSGKCVRFSIDSSSGSILEAGDLVCENAKVDASSGAILSLNVTGEIEVDASSGSIINCKGNPQANHLDLSSGAMFNK